MEQNGLPDAKRPRLNPPTTWSHESPNTRALPPPPSLPPPTVFAQQGHHPSQIYPPSFHAPRDGAMLKREADPSSPSAYTRPLSASSDYPMPPPPPPPAEDRGHPVAQHYAPRVEHQSPVNAPPNYRNNYPPPHSPLSATPTFETHPPNFHPYPPAILPYAAPLATTAKRKAQRAAQACDSCRTLKAKCDEGRPDCGSCREKGIKCIYRDPPPKQIDKTTNDIAESVWRIEDMVKRHMEAFADISNSVQMLARDNERLKAAILPLEDMHAHAGRPPAQTHAAAHRSALDPPRGLPPGLSTVRPGDEDALTDDEAGDPVAPGKSSIPVNHTTGAARLLLCGPINELSKGVLKQKRVYENFPMWQEERRGCLRIYGRGEGNDFASGYDRDPLTDYGDDTASADASSDISSPAAGEEWGHVGGVEASPHGMPDFDRATVLKLVRAFKEHINNMHPLLVPSQLDALAENFLRSLPDGSARGRAADKLTPSGHAGFVVSSPNPVSPSSKRKRSATGELGEAFDPWASKPGHPFRSINSALVLTVLALGKICLHQGKLPDVHNDRNIDPTCGTGGSTAAHNGILQSPMTTSPIVPAVFSPPLPTTSPTLERGFPRSRRTSVEGSMNTPKSLARNLDLLPGLAYFALATDIIGNQLGGITLQHAHVNILAGLYHAQLARPLESYAYIQKASMIVQFLMRPKLDRLKKIAHSEVPQLIPKRDNPLIFAFWTCLQLESDILAELPCPHSGILNFEEDIPSPNLQAAGTEGFDVLVLQRYQQQLMLRKHLNMLHSMFYKPGADEQPTSKHFPTIQAVEDNLHTLVTWDEDTPPSNDILLARLRAKYYGAQVITYRPFLLKILEHSALKTAKPGYQVSSDFLSGIDVPSINTEDEINPQALAYARICIQALIKSTTPFHGIADPGKVRLVVTNVWGTAHAQWGNCIVLLAAYRDPILGPELLKVIEVEELRSIVSKTISFLKLMSMPSCALTTDWKILEIAAARTKLVPKAIVVNSSSFGSESTAS